MTVVVRSNLSQFGLGNKNTRDRTIATMKIQKNSRSRVFPTTSHSSLVTRWSTDVSRSLRLSRMPWSRDSVLRICLSRTRKCECNSLWGYVSRDCPRLPYCDIIYLSDWLSVTWSSSVSDVTSSLTSTAFRPLCWCLIWPFLSRDWGLLSSWVQKILARPWIHTWGETEMGYDVTHS